MNETKRNEADYALQRLLELEEAIGNTKTHYAAIVYKSQTHDAIITAITALRAQSEAEKKIERVSRFCKTQRSLIRNGKAQPDAKLLTDIIWILEGVAE